MKQETDNIKKNGEFKKANLILYI